MNRFRVWIRRPAVRDLLTVLLLIAAMVDLWAVMHLLLGTSFAGPTGYNTYTRQAMAWREGLTHLRADTQAERERLVSFLELAEYRDQVYVSFPPLPSVVLWPLTFLFGMNTPDNLLVKAYALGACVLMFYTLRRVGYRRMNAALSAFLFCFASSLLPMTLNGAVWYHAQMLAFFLTAAAVCLLCLDCPTAALLCYALSVACRPFNALYGLPLFITYIRVNRRAGVSLGQTALSLAPGTVLGLAVAAGLAIYNAVRFGNPLEFGHNYLAEFSYQGGVQFSIHHVEGHLSTFLWGLPFDIRDGSVVFRRYGYSLFLACPTLLLMVIWAVTDLCKKRMRWEKAAVLITCLLHGYFFFFHRTMGGFQLGARYMVDLVPYTFFYLLLTPEKKRLHAAEIFLLIQILLFTVVGVTQVHI